MTRGFSLTSKDNNIIKSINDVNIDDNINIKLNDGNIDAKIVKINKK